MDRLKASLAGFVRSTAATFVDYHALYPCAVAAQNSDGTLELTPDSKRMPGLSSIKYKVGVPGCTATVSPGSRVLLGFENGDPSRPYACGWDQVGTVTVLNIQANSVKINGGTAAVARSGDPVKVTLTSLQIGTIIAPSGGGPCTGGPIDVTGTITGGSGTVSSG